MTDFDDFKAEQPEGQQGSNFVKYCLVCGCLVGLMGLIGVGAMVFMFKSMFITDPVQVEANLQGTIPCEVPEGYAGAFGMNMMGMRMSMIGPEGMMGSGQQNVPLMIIVMQVPPGQNPQMAKAQMQAQLQQQGGMGGGNMQVEAEETATVTIRGQPVEVQTAIGVQNGQKTKQVMAIIDKAPDDPTQVLLMFMGNADTFDEAAMQAFLQSIK